MVVNLYEVNLSKMVIYDDWMMGVPPWAKPRIDVANACPPKGRSKSVLRRQEQSGPSHLIAAIHVVLQILSLRPLRLEVSTMMQCNHDVSRSAALS